MDKQEEFKNCIDDYKEAVLPFLRKYSPTLSLTAMMYGTSTFASSMEIPLEIYKKILDEMLLDYDEEIVEARKTKKILFKGAA